MLRILFSNRSSSGIQRKSPTKLTALLCVATFPLTLFLWAGVITETAYGQQKVDISETTSPLSTISQNYVKSEEIRLSKAEVALSEKASVYLANQQNSDGFIKVWLFLTDKGPQVSAFLNESAESFPTTIRSLKRRAKVNKERVVFADIPVYDEYVNQITEAGASELGRSRWLNALAVKVRYDQLESLTALPFVVEIRPSATYVRRSDDILSAPEDDGAGDVKTEPEVSPAPSSQVRGGADLNYGGSFAQITQINAHVGHNQGHNGQGVTIAMIDTGYRKTHAAFAAAFAEGRVLAEYDFINDDTNTDQEAGDPSSQRNHGTYTWSTCGGQVNGVLYGPAYGANFLLAMTENVASETMQEEYDWVEALEWADSLGADVISSSLGYSDWYVSSDFDGQTAITTVAVNLAASLGIVVCNSMGNGGPGALTLTAPADANNMLACGAVDASGILASFSSRGPTADGRIKPELCARGVATYCANPGSDVHYTSVSGTSLSTPLLAGVTAQLISARPTWPPELIMQALRESASNADFPNNSIGWGIVNLQTALDWGANFTANGETDIVIESAPASISFADISDLTATSWFWDFGDGQTSTLSAPTHAYQNTGLYDVSLTIGTTYGPIDKTKTALVALVADTIKLMNDSAYAGHPLIVSAHVVNTLPLQGFDIPVSYNTDLLISYDSVTLGDRTADFTSVALTAIDPFNKTLTVSASTIGDLLIPGDGEVMRLFFTIDEFEVGGKSSTLDTPNGGVGTPSLSHPLVNYAAEFLPAEVSTKWIVRGDFNNNGRINIADVTGLIAFIFTGGVAPVTIQSGDSNADLSLNITDATYVIAYIFTGGPPPPSP